MTITLTITGESPEEVSAALTGLAGTVGNAPAAAPKKPKAAAATATTEAPAAGTEGNQTPAAGATEETPEGGNEPVTLESLRILVQKHMDNKKQPELRQVFAELEVKNVSGLTKDKYEIAYEKLNAIV